jgi:hypothetical protein
MPDLQRVQQAMAQRPSIAFVILQAREKFEVSRQWAEKQNIALPLADSGSTGDEDATFRLAGGGRIKDREIANRSAPMSSTVMALWFSRMSGRSIGYDKPFLRDIADRKAMVGLIFVAALAFLPYPQRWRIRGDFQLGGSCHAIRCQSSASCVGLRRAWRHQLGCVGI